MRLRSRPLSRLTVSIAFFSLMLAACGSQSTAKLPQAHRSTAGPTTSAPDSPTDPSAAVPTQAAVPTTGAGSTASPNGVVTNGHTVITFRPTATPTHNQSGNPTLTPVATPTTPTGFTNCSDSTHCGTCPDPRTCEDYSWGFGSWAADNAGYYTVHYRLNPGPPPNTGLTSAQITQAIEQAAATVMAMDPQIRLVDDGPTNATPGTPPLNDVVGFTAVSGSPTNTQLSAADSQGHFTSFDAQFNASYLWSWQSCDAVHGPCPSYSGNGYDLQAQATHVWMHVLGETDITDGSRDYLLSNFGAIATGPDCGSGGMVCRFADTPGKGDVKGLRVHYLTSASLPAFFYDQ